MVSLEKCNTYSYDVLKKAVENVISSLGGIENFVKKGDRVVIKPNLDVTTELVLEEEKSITENHEKTSSLKDLIRKASNNFFQK